MVAWRPKIAFSLRTLLAVMTLFALLSWWVSKQLAWIEQRHKALAGGRISEMRIGGINEKRMPAPWSLRLFGEPGHQIVYLAGPASLPEQDHLRQLFPESVLIGNWGLDSE